MDISRQYSNADPRDEASVERGHVFDYRDAVEEGPGAAHTAPPLQQTTSDDQLLDSDQADEPLSSQPSSVDDAPAQSPNPEDSSVQFYGRPAFGNFFFSNFFRGMLYAQYSDDNGVHAAIRNKCNSAISTASRFTLYRKFFFIASLYLVVSASLVTSPLPQPLDFFTDQQNWGGAYANIALTLLGVVVLFFLINLWLGRDYDKSIKNIQGNLINEVTGRCGNLFNDAAKCLDAIYAKQSDRSIYDKEHQAEWPDLARKQFVSGHESAKRLQFLEFFTLLEVRRVYTHFRILDLFAIGMYFLILIGVLAWVFFSNMELTIPFWVLVVSSIFVTAIFLFTGAKRDEDFPEAVINALVDEWHAFGRFGLLDRMGEIIRRDQVKIIELTGALARR